MPKETRLWALCVYKIVGKESTRYGIATRKSFYRISREAMQKQTAVQHFQDALLFGALRGVAVELRPVREANSATAPGLPALKHIVESDYREAEAI
jgi:hypothetical protein